MWLRRFGFRFGVVFAGLLIAPFPLDVLPKTGWLVERYGDLWDWAGHRFGDLIGVDVPPTQPTGSGDTTITYMITALVILLALLAAAIWTGLDRKRSAVYPRVAAVLRIALRYWLGYAMLGYGWAKVFKTQFPFPGGWKLEEPLGQMSPMGVLWNFMGYSTPYNVFAGGMECLGGVLLLSRRTTVLGALVAMATMTNVVALNFCYDVPVKLYSTELLVAAIVLLFPDLSRLIAVLLGHSAPPAEIERLTLSRRWRRIVVAAKFALLALFAYAGIHEELEMRDQFAALESPTDGRYDVVEMTPPDLGWTRVVIYWQSATIWSHGERQVMYQATAIEPHTLTLEAKDFKTDLTYAHAGDTLILDGMWGTQRLHAVLRERAPTLLETRGFNWISEFPFHR